MTVEDVSVAMLPVPVEPQRRPREHPAQVRLRLLALAGREPGGIEPEMDLRVVRSDPQSPLEQRHRWNARFERDTGVAVRDSGIDRRQPLRGFEGFQRIRVLVERAFEQPFPLPQPGIAAALNSAREQGPDCALALLGQRRSCQLAQLGIVRGAAPRGLEIVLEVHAAPFVGKSRQW